MTAISKADFSKAAGINGLPLLSSFLMNTLKIDAFNSMMENARALKGVAFADHLLKILGVTIIIDNEALARIPTDGAFITVANHPYGAIESLALLSILAKKRPETLFMGNFLLKKVPNLADHIIAVNPFENIKDASSISGLKTTLKVLKEGVPVAIFPAGEVSSYCFKKNQITDKEWHPVVGKIIAKANQPILPVYFHGNNGLLFSLARFIHPSLQTIMLFSQLFNKRGHKLYVKIGPPILPGEVAEHHSNGTTLSYLREKTYAMGSGLK
ncbi:lysophospholipid acyltransferase family protein [Mucilaginibacter sp.]|uniref:lysophospholipid acyltransferase family protein n=1 Tax=Mucilaginibacter sp. TaxID=1882438 RepID=UPI00326768AB